MYQFSVVETMDSEAASFRVNKKIIQHNTLIFSDNSNYAKNPSKGLCPLSHLLVPLSDLGPKFLPASVHRSGR